MIPKLAREDRDVALHTGRETYVSLYTGGGGLDLGFRLANPDAKCVLYVEIDLEAAALVVDHIKAGLLDAAPVWSDTGTLDCRPFAGKVDWIIGGFPCQPFSVAGKQRGIEDKRWLWEHIRRLAVEIRPRYLFLENTPGVLVRSGIGTVLGELSEIGYDAEWMCVRASDVGAPHRRERVFILAMDNNQSGGGQRVSKRRLNDVERGSRELAHTRHDARRSEQEQQHEVETAGAGQSSTDMAYSTRDGEQGPNRQTGRGRGRGVRLSSKQLAHCDNRLSDRPIEEVRAGRSPSVNGSEQLGNADEPRLQGRQQPVGQRGYELPAWPPGPSDSDAWAEVLRHRPDLAPAVGNSEGDYKQRHRKPESERTTRDNRRKSTRRRGSDIYNGTTGRDQETPEPAVRGVADGMARGLARSTQLRILGNGVVPHQAALAFQILKERASS